MKILAFNIVSILLVILAGYMIYADKSDWGWVVFAALLCTATGYREKDKDSKDIEN